MNVFYVKIQPINEIDKILYDKFTSKFRKGWIEVGEEKICMPEYYQTIANDVENFEIRDSDILICTHPKTGTTWMQEMVWMIANNLDFQGAKQQLYKRSPFLEFQGLLDFTNEESADIREEVPEYIQNSVELTKKCSHNPRIIKTHMPFSLLPKQIRDKIVKPKIIYVIRNAKDTCISYYHHCRLVEGFTGNLEEFCKLFKAGRVPYSPFWKNVLGYWNNQKLYDILIIKFEDMKKDLKTVIKQIAEYLNKSLTADQIVQLEDHLRFENMKKNKYVNLEDLVEFTKKFTKVEGTFMRSGTIGNYSKEMSEEMINEFEKWTEENIAGTGLSF